MFVLLMYLVGSAGSVFRRLVPSCFNLTKSEMIVWIVDICLILQRVCGTVGVLWIYCGAVRH